MIGRLSDELIEEKNQIPVQADARSNQWDRYR